MFFISNTIYYMLFLTVRCIPSFVTVIFLFISSVIYCWSGFYVHKKNINIKEKKKIAITHLRYAMGSQTMYHLIDKDKVAKQHI